MNPKLAELLAREYVTFEVIDHRNVYTAQERAAACHMSGRRLAKVVVVHDPEDDWFALVVLPASARLDLLHLREITGRSRLRLATEAQFARLFPDCEVGAMPPFGRMYQGLEVYLDSALARDAQLVFPGGTHHEEVRMAMGDYVRIERPAVLPLTAALRAA